ncbi:lysosomal acid phosphatase-like [Mytilus galloprovincialis]|uniref:lysosomal acid phosphatase-like n=1 Tax=Mytilus galloprovincialis TaxID=29158 RepID=UPI003F7C5883
MSSKAKIFLNNIFIFFAFIPIVKQELVLLQVLYRHGDRSPVAVYPKDPNTELSWPMGLGQLTNEGKEQEYYLGQILRRRYGDNLKFLNKTFNVKDVYVRSTDYDRTLMSAYCMLAGLFPPTKEDSWNENITWQPIPVHTEPTKDDHLIYLDNPCPVFTSKMEYFMSHDPEVLQVKNNTQDLVKYVAEHSGLPATFQGMMKILDTIFCEQTHNKKQPDWLNADTLKRLNYIQKTYKVKWWYPTHEMAVLKGGNLLKKIYEDMQTKLNTPANLTQKIMVYSAHDSTVAALLKTMKIFNDRTPTYSSCVMIELHDDNTVRILYRNNTFTDDIVTLTLPGCSEFCDIDQFHTILNDSMPADWRKACGLSDANEQNFKNNILGYSVMACIIFLLTLLVVTICCIYQRQRKQYRYMELPTDMAES